MTKKTIVVLGVLLALVWCGAVSRAEVIDLRPQWDDKTPLPNPHKGWYHHYFDNHVNKYLAESDEELLRVPGLDHLYLRLAWSYLEPEEGKFNWRIIDEVIDKWTPRGVGISFRISCKETSTDRIEQRFATPRWVKEAGAAGGFYTRSGEAGDEASAPWEPVFDDPVFLKKLDRFLATFAQRYDGKPWLRYVDVGSFGDWGEGHTSSGSRRKYGYDALLPHVEMHLKHFKRTPLVISDDFVYSLSDLEQRQKMHRLLIDRGVSYRDDSILVDGYLKGRSSTFTVRSPEFFADAWLKTPTVLELEHYGTVKQKGNWIAQPGSSLERFGQGKRGEDYFRGAMQLLHATYIGYHGYARQWLADNPQLTVELLNRCGYWYFPQSIEVPALARAGARCEVKIHWENHGVARAYHPFNLILRLTGADALQQEVPAGNLRWLPAPSDRRCEESYALDLPATLKNGKYVLAIKMVSPSAGRDVRLALKSSLLDGSGFYVVGELEVAGGR